MKFTASFEAVFYFPVPEIKIRRVLKIIERSKKTERFFT